MSHEDPNVVTEVLNKVTDHFGDLVTTRGDSHNFLSIGIKIRKDGLVAIEQHKHIEESLNTFGPTFTHYVSSPCAQHLWHVND